MSTDFFLDTGVMFGYAVPLDKHHFSCKEFISEHNAPFYTCQTAYSEFKNLKQKRIKEFSTAVLDHLRNLKKADLDRSLGPTDLKYIKTHHLNRSNDAYQYLYRYYDNALDEEYFEIDPPNSFADRNQIFNDLRNIARDAEKIANNQSKKINKQVKEWSRQKTHSSIRSRLSMIDPNDRTICIAAHDFADINNTTVIFTTTNPRDFVEDNRENLILRTTAIADIKDVSI